MDNLTFPLFQGKRIPLQLHQHLKRIPLQLHQHLKRIPLQLQQYLKVQKMECRFC
jgi:hypothetical protein